MSASADEHDGCPAMTWDAYERRRGRRVPFFLALGVAVLVVWAGLLLFGFVEGGSSFGSPPPCDPNGQFSAILGNSIGGTEAFVNVTDQSVCILSAKATSVNLTSTLHPANFLCAHAGGAGDPYNESVGGIRGGVWTAGETWSLHLVGGPGGTVCGSPPDLSSCGDNVTVTVRDAAASDPILWQATLPGLGPLSRCP